MSFSYVKLIKVLDEVDFANNKIPIKLRADVEEFQLY